MRSTRTFVSKSIIYLGTLLLLCIFTIPFYPYIKSAYLSALGKSSLIFIDVTDSAGLMRHHSGPAWLSTFSVSVVDYDNDGKEDLFVNNHERNRPYFYRNTGDGTFSEVHESIGLLENQIGPVFGSPKFVDSSLGFFIWLDPETAINGTWHLRWLGQDSQSTQVSGELSTNTQLEEVRAVNLSSQDYLKKEGSSFTFDASADRSVRGVDFKSSFPESTIQFDLRINGKEDIHKVFIGPHNVSPTSMPFNLSLGDRHATVWGDFNNDGHVDLFVTRGAMVGILKPPHGAKHEELFKSSADAHFSNVIAESNIRNDFGRGRDAQWVDYNNDGLLDLYITNFDSKNLLYKNRGDSTFEETTKEAGLDSVKGEHCLWADFNNDGYPDVFFTNPDSLFLNKGDGTFVNATVASKLNVDHKYENAKDAMFWGSGASAADYDNDGDLDLFVASGKGGDKSRLFEDQGGTFIDITDKARLSHLNNVREGIWGDFNNDGYIDLYTIGTSPESNRLLMNNGNKTFTDVTEQLNLSLADRIEWDLSSHAGGVATWIDYNNDGFLDLFLATKRVSDSPGSSPADLTQSVRETVKKYMKGKIAGTHFLLKNTGNGNHWIKIKLLGTTSNRDGFGAKVFVATGNTTQFQEAGASGKTLFAQNNAPLHFGLGKADIVKSVKVIWPSGKQQIVNDVGVNQVVRIEEPASASNPVK